MATRPQDRGVQEATLGRCGSGCGRTRKERPKRRRATLPGAISVYSTTIAATDLLGARPCATCSQAGARQRARLMAIGHPTRVAGRSASRGLLAVRFPLLGMLAAVRRSLDRSPERGCDQSRCGCAWRDFVPVNPAHQPRSHSRALLAETSRRALKCCTARK
jgi:hypothetical protein